MAVEQANVKLWTCKTPVVPEGHKPTETCEHPERWSMFDPETAEVEVLKLIRSLVRTVKPQKVVTVGDPNGTLTAFIGQALRENGAGECLAVGIPDSGKDAAIGKIYGGGLQRWVEITEGADIPLNNDLVVVNNYDVDGEFIKFVKPSGLLIVHGTADKPLGDVGDCQILYLPTPRGLSILSK